MDLVALFLVAHFAFYRTESSKIPDVVGNFVLGVVHAMFSPSYTDGKNFK